MRVNVSVGGLWRTHVTVNEATTRRELGHLIEVATGVPATNMKVSPFDDIYYSRLPCGLVDDDEVVCTWTLGHGMHPIHCAARRNNVEAIRSWVASGTEVDRTDIFGQTPLLEALEAFSVACIDELLRLGADASVVNRFGDNVLIRLAIAASDIRWTRRIIDTSPDAIERIIRQLLLAGAHMPVDNAEFFDRVRTTGGERYATMLETIVDSMRVT